MSIESYPIIIHKLSTIKTTQNQQYSRERIHELIFKNKNALENEKCVQKT